MLLIVMDNDTSLIGIMHDNKLIWLQIWTGQNKFYPVGCSWNNAWISGKHSYKVAVSRVS